jgi:hypothetical protein
MSPVFFSEFILAGIFISPLPLMSLSVKVTFVAHGMQASESTPRPSGLPAALSLVGSPASKKDQAAAFVPAPDTEEALEAYILQRVATVCSWQPPTQTPGQQVKHS